MGVASMRKWTRRYGSHQAAIHARLRERRRRAFDRTMERAIQLGERTGEDPATFLRDATLRVPD